MKLKVPGKALEKRRLVGIEQMSNVCAQEFELDIKQ
jgi:hypothetical protein